MKDYAYYNGIFSPFEKTSISLSDRSIYFGDGCYDVILLHNGTPYQFEEHFSRLLCNCNRLFLSLDLNQRQLLSIIHRLSDLSSISSGVIYVQISRNGGKRKHEISVDSRSNVLITLTKYSLSDRSPLKAITVEDKRHTLCDIKTLNLIYSVISIKQANDLGCDCAIYIRDNIVTEEARSSVLILVGDELITHPLDDCILPGIMRSNILRSADYLRLKVKEEKFTYSDMLKSDEVFVCSTTKFISRISEIDGIRVGLKNDGIFTDLYNHLLRDFTHKTV